jgi:uncharacterized protein (TIGR00725 family)
MAKLMIGIIGAGSRDTEGFLTAQALSAAELVGRLLARQGAVVVSVGMSGVMEAVSKGAHLEGGLTLGIIPGTDKSTANPYVDLPVTTGMGLLRNSLTIRASDAVILISGGLGTLNELTVALMERSTPVVVLEGTGGWADRVRTVAYDGCYLDERRAMPVHFAGTPDEAVELAVQLGTERQNQAAAKRLQTKKGRADE